MKGFRRKQSHSKQYVEDRQTEMANYSNSSKNYQNLEIIEENDWLN